MRMKRFCLLQLVTAATTFHLSPLHGHATSAHCAAARVQPLLSSPNNPGEADDRNPLDDISGVFKGGIEDAVKKVTGNEEYQFGDFTKSTVKGLTGKEAGDYQCRPNLELAACGVKPRPSPDRVSTRARVRSATSRRKPSWTSRARKPASTSLATSRTAS